MPLQRFDFTYSVTEFGSIEVDIDKHIDAVEAEEIAIKAIEEDYKDYPDIQDIKITGHRLV